MTSSIIEILLEFGGIFSTFGINIPALGMYYNLFGSVFVTSLESINVKDVYAPLCPFSQTAGVFTCCSIFKKKILNKDGVYEEKEYLPVNFSIDHRYVDGILCAKMVKEAKKVFDDPELFTIK